MGLEQLRLTNGCTSDKVNRDIPRPSRAVSWKYLPTAFVYNLINLYNCRGQDLTIKVKFRAPKVIENGATADILVKMGLVKFLKISVDICEELRDKNATMQCPIEAGEHTFEHTTLLPKEIPRTKFFIDISGFTAEDENMFCTNFAVDFMTRHSTLDVDSQEL